MSIPEPFPEDILSEIREYPGNHKCCDCQSLDTDWGSITHGTLICLECAGKHRSLGVQVSFVRSIRMDSWSQQQVEMMRQGGNDQIRRFFKKLEIENSPIQMLYCTKGASHYRERLKERVMKITSGEIKSEKRVGHNRSLSEKLKETVQQSSPGISVSGSCGADCSLNIVFKDGPMGLTLTKDCREMAIVSKVLPGGQAHRSGVLVGDYVAGVSGKAMTRYDEIMHTIPALPRPLTVRFNRVAALTLARNGSRSAVTANGIGFISSLHSSRSESSLTASTAADAFSESYRSTQQEAGGGSRTTSSDGPTSPSLAVGSRSSSRDLGATPITPRSASNVRTRLTGASSTPRLGSSSDGEESSLIAIRAKMSPRTAAARSISKRLSPAPETKLSSSAPAGFTQEGTLSRRLYFEEEEQSSSARSTPFVLEAGATIKVLQGGDGKRWRNAVVTRRHRDGSYKVLYRDGTTEAHVPVSRMSINSQTQPETAKLDGKDSGAGGESASSPVDSDLADIQTNVGAGLETDSSAPIGIAFPKARVPAPETDSEAVTPMGDNGSNSMSGTDMESDLWIAASGDCDCAAQIARESGGGNCSSCCMSLSASDEKETIIDAVFQHPPLGITLSAGGQSKEPRVTRLVEGSQAAQQGLRMGDVLVRIADRVVAAYDDAMQVLLSSRYPLSLRFRRVEVREVAAFRIETGPVRAECEEVCALSEKELASLVASSLGIS